MQGAHIVIHSIIHGTNSVESPKPSWPRRMSNLSFLNWSNPWIRSKNCLRRSHRRAPLRDVISCTGYQKFGNKAGRSCRLSAIPNQWYRQFSDVISISKRTLLFAYLHTVGHNDITRQNSARCNRTFVKTRAITLHIITYHYTYLEASGV